MPDSRKDFFKAFLVSISEESAKGTLARTDRKTNEAGSPKKIKTIYL